MTQKELEIFVKVKLMETGDVSQADAARALHMLPSTFNRKLKNGPITYLEMVELADFLGYKIVWEKKDGEGMADSPAPVV